jgi:hypothetical protein
VRAVVNRPEPTALVFFFTRICPIFRAEEIEMTAPSFALAIFAALAALALTIWALSAWGALVVVPGLLCLGLVAVWAFSHGQYDDGHTG